MPPEIAKEWIEKAEEDYGFACASIESMDYFAQVCFHFQQAAEKYLKAFIVANKLEFRAVHNLLELLETCRQNEPGIVELEQACRFLNPFYIDTRYPVHWPAQYDKDTAIEAKEETRKIRDWIKKSLNA
ncbi:MAG: HEPN domain-containing protein [Sedimentisphaerales bacterium]